METNALFAKIGSFHRKKKNENQQIRISGESKTVAGLMGLIKTGANDFTPNHLNALRLRQ